MINHVLCLQSPVYYIMYYGFMRRVDRYSRDDKNVYTYTRLIIYHGGAVKILVEHFIFYYTDGSSIWYNRAFNSCGTQMYYCRNSIHGRKVNDLGKRFHATHINRQTRRLITTLYEYLPLVSINNNMLHCVPIILYTGTYSRFFIPVLRIYKIDNRQHQRIPVIRFFFVSSIVSPRSIICGGRL